MKWFTRALYERGLADDLWDAALAGYESHLTDLLPRFPAPLRDLAQTNLHDARFTAATLDPLNWNIELRLVGGDHEHTYFQLTTTYRQASLSGVSPDELANLLTTPETEVLYDELDADEGGRYEHRFLLWPRGEFAVRFAGVDLRTAPAPSDEYEAAWGPAEIIEKAIG